MKKDCKYRLPCGRCDKYDKECDAPECKHNWKFVQEYWNSETNYFFKKYVCTECGDIEYVAS